jgi:hypothetical protein
VSRNRRHIDPCPATTGFGIGMTPPRTLSSAEMMLLAAAMIPRASATIAAQSPHSATCFATPAASSRASAPSSHA